MKGRILNRIRPFAVHIDRRLPHRVLLDSGVEISFNVSWGTEHKLKVWEAFTQRAAERGPDELESDMQGHITKFREDIGFGIIHSEDGRKFRFSRSEICNPNGKLIGLDVDFLIESRKPRDIVLLHGSPWGVFAHTNEFAKRS